MLALTGRLAILRDMNVKTAILLTVLLLSAAGLTACGADVLPVDGATPLPAAAPTVTPGGMIVIWLPTEGPPTPTPTPLPPTPDYLLTALPPDGGTAAECPPPGNPPPPDPPATYSQYMTVINRFLSDGGSVPFLSSILSTWGAIGDDYGLVTDAYDLTGDGVFEVIVIISDPFNAEVSPLPGQLLVFGCHEGGYRLLYGSDFGPGFGVPSLLYVGDMNADTRPEMVFFQQRCQRGDCVQAAQVLTWSTPNDGFLTLNVDTVGSPDGRFSIQDLDADGILEIMIQGGGISTDVSAGPPRSSTTVWDWNGLNYVRALTQLDPPLYRIHVIHDADRALEQGDGDEAIRLYREALDNPRLGSWQVPNEPVMLRAYALYRLIVAYAFMDRDDDALDTYSTLMADNQPGTPGYVYAALGDAFWRAFQASHNLHTGCMAAAEMVATYPEAVLFLNSYGPANRTYQIPDICPF